MRLTKTSAAKGLWSGGAISMVASAATLIGPAHVLAGATARCMVRAILMTNEQKQAPRFFLDHGVIHDRVTGKHVVTDGEPPFEDSVEQVCNLLNSICAPSRCDLCGFGECLATTANCPRLAASTLPSQQGNCK